MIDDNTMTFSFEKERYEYHSKKRRRKIIRLLIALVIWAVLIIYLLTPFSKYKMMHVKGNVYIKEDEIIEMANIKNTWWWLVDSSELKLALEKHENIDNVSISKGFNGLNISIFERYPIAIKEDKYVLNTLELINKEDYKIDIGDVIEVNELDSQYLNLFANQYIHVDLDIRNTFYKAIMEDNKTIVLKGKFSESSYFEMKLDIDSLAIKLSSSNFIKIREEILGKMSIDNVEYSKENPCIVRYNLTNVYEYEIG